MSQELNEERIYINNTRIEIIRQMRKSFGTSFTGGVSPSALSRELCPDLVLPSRATNRNNYIKLLHKSDICIATMGLHESIGWKTAEYVAASKAIVAEKMRYEVPGDFREGKNYLLFESAEECMQKVRQLTENKELLMTMKKNNYDYYWNYLHPESLIRNTFGIVYNQSAENAE